MKMKNADFLKTVRIGRAAFAAALLLLTLSGADVFTETVFAAQLPTASNDRYTSSQWAITNPGAYRYVSGSLDGTVNSTEDVDVDGKEAWTVYNTNKLKLESVTVAVIDTGVDYEHEDIRGNLWINYDEMRNLVPDDKGNIVPDGIDNDGNGYVDDMYGWDFYNNDNTVCHYMKSSLSGENIADPKDNDDHGTHVAGIIGAVANNNLGIAGLASNIDVRIMPLKIHGGSDRKGDTADAVKAIRYAEMMGAKVCNISWGTYTYSEALYQAMRDSSMLFVCAAGNDGTNNDYTLLYPAGFDLPNVISVAYVDANGKLTVGSNYGQTVDIAAPGSDIMSTYVGTYAMDSGSSMAAPHVSAVAAMLFAYGKGTYPAEVKRIILNYYKQLDSLVGYIKNPGIVDAYRCVNAASKMRLDENAPVLSLSSSNDREYFKINIDAVDEESGIALLRYLPGDKPVSMFKKGAQGNVINGKSFRVNVTGLYTVYAKDFAGNETVKVYELFDDYEPPQIKAAYTASSDYRKFSVDVTAMDTESGVKAIRYEQGVHTVSEFRSGLKGTSVSVNKKGKASFNVSKPGYYTICVQDYRNNRSCIIVNVKIVKSSGLQLPKAAKKLDVGKSYRIKPVLTPANSTDAVSFTSSDSEICTVGAKGKVTALKKGTAAITVRTASGLSQTVKITVK